MLLITYFQYLFLFAFLFIITILETRYLFYIFNIIAVYFLNDFYFFNVRSHASD